MFFATMKLFQRSSPENTPFLSMRRKEKNLYHVEDLYRVPWH